MSDNSLKLEVQQLIFGPLNWEKVIAADLVKEIEKAVAEKTQTVPEMRRFLAIKGYRALNELLSKESEGKIGPEALKAMAHCSRTFAKERPGLAAATFRNPIDDSAESAEATATYKRLYITAFKQCGVEQQFAENALLIMRALVRGFVVNEMSQSLLSAEMFDESFRMAINVFILGLPALKQIEQPKIGDQLCQARDRIKMSDVAIVNHFKTLGYAVTIDELVFTTESVDDFFNARENVWHRPGIVEKHDERGLLVITHTQPQANQPSRDVAVVSLGFARVVMGVLQGAKVDPRFPRYAKTMG